MDSAAAEQAGLAAVWERLDAAAVPQAAAVARAAVRAKPRRTGDGTAPGWAVVERLAAADPKALRRVAAEPARQSVTVHRRVFADADRGAFAPGVPALAVCTYQPDGTNQISVLDPRGEWVDVYAGGAQHAGMCCLGPEDVLAVRSPDPRGRELELVRYTAGSETWLAGGSFLANARPMAVRDGFVVGLPTQAGALVCGVDLPLHGITLGTDDGRTTDLRRDEVRTDSFAVDPSGTRVAFGGRRLRVVDARVQAVVAEGPQLPSSADLRELVFTSPQHIVSAGDNGVLRRWVLHEGQAVAAVQVGTQPRVSSLFAVPAWEVVGGRVDSEGRHQFFHWESLAPVDPPGPLATASYGHAAAVIASPDGRFVAAGGQLLVDAPQPERSFDVVTAVHDLRHPLSWVERPLGSLTGADLAELSDLLGGRPRPGLSGPRSLTGEERDILTLIHDYAAVRQVG